jgi:lipopolysaccharide assembly outer membrane protein LptD (OstA)
VVTVVSASRIDVPFSMQVAPPEERPPAFPPPPFRRSAVDIRADSQTREGNVIRYRGNVRMRTNGAEIAADELDFNIDTSTADARGMVQVRVLPSEYRVIPLTER